VEPRAGVEHEREQRARAAVFRPEEFLDFVAGEDVGERCVVVRARDAGGGVGDAEPPLGPAVEGAEVAEEGVARRAGYVELREEPLDGERLPWQRVRVRGRVAAEGVGVAAARRGRYGASAEERGDRVGCGAGPVCCGDCEGRGCARP
jgi:hypothetical protein